MNWIDDLSAEYGTVTGRFVRVEHDSADEDLLPDVQPLNGTVLLTPTVDAGRIGSEVFAQISPVTARIFGGQIVDDEEIPGIRILATDANIGVADWAWTATFDLEGALKLQPLTFKLPRDTTVNLTSGIVPTKSAPYQIVQGEPGESAYEVARLHGYTGTEAEWLASLKGDPGVADPDWAPAIAALNAAAT